MLETKINELIQNSDSLTRYRIPPKSVNHCASEAYDLTNRVAIQRGLNGSSYWKVFIDGVRVGGVEHDDIYEAMENRKNSIIAEKLNSI
jgi:hypothetical protein